MIEQHVEPGAEPAAGRALGVTVEGVPVELIVVPPALSDPDEMTVGLVGTLHPHTLLAAV